LYTTHIQGILNIKIIYDTNLAESVNKKSENKAGNNKKGSLVKLNPFLKICNKILTSSDFEI